MKERRLILSALPYVNNFPHLGNVVGCVLSSDVYSRFCKKRGYKTVHICGTDEHGAATELEAMSKNQTPLELCNNNHQWHKKVYDWFGIEFDYFGRTTEEDHKINTTEMFNRIDDNQFLESKNIKQFYCSTCKIFLPDRYIEGTCSNCKKPGSKGDQCDSCGYVFSQMEIIDPICVICLNTPIVKTSDHIFLCLNLLTNQIKSSVNQRIQEWSNNSIEITKEWLKKDLKPRCITRDLKFSWGVPVHKKGFEGKVLYVWFDAPIGYISFAKQFLKESYKSFMQDCKIYGFMGKDNVPFHSIFFTGICVGSNTDFFIDVISSTEYLLFGGKKFSKSKKVGIFGSDLLTNMYGSACLWRYYLMKIRPENKDSNFTYLDFKSSINSDLINNIGNFCNRTLKYISKRLGGTISYQKTPDDETFIRKVNGLYTEYLVIMEKIKLKHSTKIILSMANIGNLYIQNAVSKDEMRKKSCFSIAASLILYLGHTLEPFIPETSKKIFKMLNIDCYNKIYPKNFVLIEQNHKISDCVHPIFDPFTPEELSRMND